MASFDLDITLDKRKVEKWLKALGDKAIGKATARAINKTLVTVRKESAPMLLKRMGDFGLSKAAIKRELVIKRATRRYQVGYIRVEGKRIPLSKFKARKIKTGVKVRVKGKTRVIKHAFIQTMKSGHKGVYWRKEQKNRVRARGGSTTQSSKVFARLPIQELFGPSIPSEFKGGVLQRHFRKLSARVWPTRFDHEIQYELRKLK